MGSADTGTSIITELQHDDMDDLNRFQYSAEYSADISNKMQMPSRLSVGPESNSMMDESATDVRNGGFTSSPAHGMNVPDRILLAGSGSHVGLRDSPRDLNLEDLPSFPRGEVELTTPPRTLTLGEVHFPTVGTESKRPKPINTGVGDNSAIMNSSEALDVTDSGVTLDQQLKLLAEKVSTLEEQQANLEYREHLFIAGLVVYMLYKGFKYVTSPY